MCILAPISANNWSRENLTIQRMRNCISIQYPKTHDHKYTTPPPAPLCARCWQIPDSARRIGSRAAQICR